MVDPV
jgi:hypothetical protein